MNFRGVVGVQGDVTPGWHYNAFGPYYYVTVDQRNGGYLSNQKVNNALQVGGTAANPGCLNGGIGGCGPYNIFSQGGRRPAPSGYLSANRTSRGRRAGGNNETRLTRDVGAHPVRS